MLNELLFFGLVTLLIVAPLITPNSKWFWILSVSLILYLVYENYQSYLYRIDVSNKYSPGHMAGDLILRDITVIFLLAVTIRIVIWSFLKFKKKKSHNKSLKSGTPQSGAP